MEAVARSTTKIVAATNYDVTTLQTSPPKKSLISIIRPASSSVKLSLLSVSSRRFTAVQCIASPQTQIWTGLESAAEIQTTQPTKTVVVKFQLMKKCSFGEEFLILGDDPSLGSWDPSNAVPLHWSDGHLWTTELDIPAERTIKFKFVLRQNTGKILWQPGPDRIFSTLEANSGITVTENWENATADVAGLEKASEEQVTSPVMEEKTTTDPEIELDYKVVVPNIRDEPNLNGLKDWSNNNNTRRLADEQPVLLNYEEMKQQPVFVPASMTSPTTMPLISATVQEMPDIMSDLAAPTAQEMPDIMS